MATDLRAAFTAKRYKFASDELEDRCASLALVHDLSAGELALEFERVMMTRLVLASFLTPTTAQRYTFILRTSLPCI